MKRDMALWQALLRADLPPYKLRVACEHLRRNAVAKNPLEAVREVPGLSEAQRERAELDEAAVERAAAQGVCLFDTEALGDRAGEASLPPRLFAWGDPGCLLRTCVAIVGTRAASVYGKAVATKFAEAFAQAGITVVSGGALGIDAAAHEAALAAGGKTAAVLASGVDRAYPAMHRGLFQRIRESGVLVSQFPLGQLPRHRSFLERNTVVAALSHAVLVVEAPERSGSLSTAHAANEFGRQVFVVPANISALTFRGSHNLIRQGATLVDHPDQVLEDLGLERPERAASQPEGLSEEQALILTSLTIEPLSTEQLSQRTGIAPQSLLAELTMLELSGRILRSAGGYSLKP